MVKDTEIGKNVILQGKNIDFSVQEIYKLFKRSADEAGYHYQEKKHQDKSDKYGREVSFEITLTKEFEGYAKAEFNITITMSALKNVGGKQRGNIKIFISGKLYYDLKDSYEKNTASKFLSKVFLAYGGKDRLDKYKDPAKDFKKGLVNQLKELCDFYETT